MVLVRHTGGGAAYSNIMHSDIRNLVRKYNSLMEAAKKQQLYLLMPSNLEERLHVN